MSVDNVTILGRLAVALALGLLIGLERGWELRELPEGQRIAGLRTFGLISLLGGVTILLAAQPQGLYLSAVVVVLGALVALGYWRESASSADVSLTTTIAALIAFGLGALAGTGQLTVAASTAVVVTLLLGFKPELHHLIRAIERQELLATLRLLLISVVLLPILPDKGFGPWQALNPYKLWWMVVLVAAVSYVGYFGIKLLDRKRGVLATGLLGGLASSTAVAVAMAHRGKEEPEMQDLLAAGVVIASATMFPRMIVIAFAILPALGQQLLWPLLSAGVVGCLAAAWYAWRSGQGKLSQGGEEMITTNPLELTMALKFGVLLAVIMVLTRALREWMGDPGLYALAAVSGLVDVDAITLSVASITKHGETTIAIAAAVLLVPAAVNTAVKAALVTAICGARMGLRVTAALLASLLAGAFGLWISIHS